MPDSSSAPITPAPAAPAPSKSRGFPWYFATRAIGAAILLFGVFHDHTSDRGTIILTGAGLLGLDKVARSEVGAG